MTNKIFGLVTSEPAGPGTSCATSAISVDAAQMPLSLRINGAGELEYQWCFALATSTLGLDWSFFAIAKPKTLQ